MCSGSEVRYVRTLMKRLAGFTAAAEVGGEYYFGSDFSGRPNFIKVLGGPLPRLSRYLSREPQTDRGFPTQFEPVRT